MASPATAPPPAIPPSPPPPSPSPSPAPESAPAPPDVPENAVTVAAERPSTPPDELRCTRNDGKLWRCKHRKRHDHPLCDLHYTVRRTTPVKPRGTPTRSEKDIWPNGRRGRCHPRKPPVSEDDLVPKGKRKRGAGTERRKRNRKVAGEVEVVRGIGDGEAEALVDCPGVDPNVNVEALVVTELGEHGLEGASESDGGSNQEKNNVETTLLVSLEPEASESNFLVATPHHQIAPESSAAAAPIQNPEHGCCSCSSKFSVAVCMEEMKKYNDIDVSKRLKAMQELQSESWREIFICMDEELRREWIGRLE